MAKRGSTSARHKTAADDNKNTTWVAALVPCDGITGNIKWRRTVFMYGDGASKGEQERFYEALLQIPWLAPTIRHAVIRGLGRLLREHNRGIEHALTATLRVLIGERKKNLRKQGQRPRGGIHEQVITEIAHGQGMTVEALKKRLQRDNQRQK